MPDLLATKAAIKKVLGITGEVTDTKYHVPVISGERAIVGNAIPSASITIPTTSLPLMAVQGCFNGLTQTSVGTPTIGMDSTEGKFTNFVSTGVSNQNCGITTAAVGNDVTRREFNPVLRARFKMDSTATGRVWIGLIDGAVAISDTPMATGIPGVLFGYSTADTVFSVRSNDNSGTAVTTAMTGQTKDANWHTVSITLNNSVPNAVVVLDDGAGTKTQTITTAADLPLSTSNLGVTCTGQTSSTAVRTLSLKFCSLYADK